ALMTSRRLVGAEGRAPATAAARLAADASRSAELGAPARARDSSRAARTRFVTKLRPSASIARTSGGSARTRSTEGSDRRGSFTRTFLGSLRLSFGGGGRESNPPGRVARPQRF